MTIDLEFFASLSDKVDQMHDKLIHERKTPVFQVPFIVNAGTATFDDPAQLAPTRETCWSIRRLTLWGWSAGSVQVQINNLEPVINAAAAPSPNFYAKGAFLLQPGDRIVVVPTGITGSVFMSVAPDIFPFWYLREYLD